MLDKPSVVLSIPTILERKKNGQDLSDDEIQYFVDSVCDETIHPSQIGAMLMSFCLKGLTTEETTSLTRCMMNSGTVQKWDPSWTVVDKHSTGGVGDKVTFPLVAALACFPVKIPMIAGRGLGHTGGTIDKLEAIPGFDYRLTEEKMWSSLREIGCYITTQNLNIAPADKTLYATRDITSTARYAPLVCASIMSKKLAEGLDLLVLDVKSGNAALTNSYDESQWLATTMRDIGEAMGVKTTAVITEMDTPIGYTIGNSLEIIESMECIRGNGPEDLESITSVQAGILLVKAGLAPDQATAEAMVRSKFRDGSALDAFLRILRNQGVEEKTAEQLRQGSYEAVMGRASQVEVVRAKEDGYIEAVDAMALAKAAVLFGCGRQVPGDKIDHTAGIRLFKTKGDKVSVGEAILEVHHNGRVSDTILGQIKGAFTIGGECRPISRILKKIEES